MGRDQGVIPLDSANSRTIGIEAQNNGTGEAWAPVMLDAYERLVGALCSAYGLNPDQDVPAHYEWARAGKIDPWGGSTATPGHPYSGPRSWAMAQFSEYVRSTMGGTPPGKDDDDVGYLYSDPPLVQRVDHPVGDQRRRGRGRRAAGPGRAPGLQPKRSGRRGVLPRLVGHRSRDPVGAIELAVRGGFLVPTVTRPEPAPAECTVGALT
jgi:hypothetical protein